MIMKMPVGSLPPGSMTVPVKTTSAAELWAGDFGNAYLKRNQVEWINRIHFWELMIETTLARSVFEMGANAGWNLSAIREVSQNIQLYGNDINPVAVNQAQLAGHHVVCKLDFANELPGPMELVFTAGVLIHIEPENLKEVMQALIDKSCNYVLAIEYAADEETIVEYHGHSDRLWKRNYGKLYEDLGLTLLDVGHAEGFDNCTYWLLQK